MWCSDPSRAHSTESNDVLFVGHGFLGVRRWCRGRAPAAPRTPRHCRAGLLRPAPAGIRRPAGRCYLRVGSRRETLGAVEPYRGKARIVALTDTESPRSPALRTPWSRSSPGRRPVASPAGRSSTLWPPCWLSRPSPRGAPQTSGLCCTRRSRRRPTSSSAATSWLAEVAARLDGPDGVYVAAPARRLSSAQQSALMVREGPRRPASRLRDRRLEPRRRLSHQDARLPAAAAGRIELRRRAPRMDVAAPLDGGGGRSRHRATRRCPSLPPRRRRRRTAAHRGRLSPSSSLSNGGLREIRPCLGIVRTTQRPAPRRPRSRGRRQRGGRGRRGRDAARRRPDTRQAQGAGRRRGCSTIRTPWSSAATRCSTSHGAGYGKPLDAADAVTPMAGDARATGRAAYRALRPAAAAPRSSAVASTTVRFGSPSEAEIEAYVASGEPLACRRRLHPRRTRRAGSSTASTVTRRNVVGLSLPLLRALLADLGVTVPDLWSSTA